MSPTRPDSEAWPEVSVLSRPLWRLRLASALPRYALYATCAAGLAASARFAIAPPHVRVPATVAAQSTDDPAAQGYACLFARRYLTWSGTEPLAAEQALEGFGGAALEAGLGLRVPPSGEQRVEWAEVVQERQPTPGEHVYTVAVQTDSAGLLYLSVPVIRTAGQGLSLGGYPAFVGAPAAGPARPLAQAAEVTDPRLVTVVERALRNYVSGSEANLAADLAGGARVSTPQPGLSVEAVAHPRWASGGGSVLAVVQARDAHEAHYALEYELDVVRAGGRWEVGAVQMDPQE